MPSRYLEAPKVELLIESYDRDHTNPRSESISAFYSTKTDLRCPPAHADRLPGTNSDRRNQTTDHDKKHNSVFEFDPTADPNYFKTIPEGQKHLSIPLLEDHNDGGTSHTATLPNGSITIKEALENIEPPEKQPLFPTKYPKHQDLESDMALIVTVSSRTQRILTLATALLAAAFLAQGIVFLALALNYPHAANARRLAKRVITTDTIVVVIVCMGLAFVFICVFWVVWYMRRTPRQYR